MTQLLWDQVGERLFQAGLDRGVLYKSDRSGVAWNGLRSVIESISGRTVTPHYHDGVKYTESQILGEYAGTLAALTYPDEFLEYEGQAEYEDGVYFKNQRLKRFHLSYRTLVGNDVQGQQYGYKIHILYNLLAIPRDMNSQTLNATPIALEFGWTLTSVPEVIDGYTPISHVIIDSTEIDDDKLYDLEQILYGNSENDAYLPTLAELKEFLDNWEGITIIDNGDGTWTAIGSDNFIHVLSDEEFQITEANATYLDADTFEISSGTE